MSVFKIKPLFVFCLFVVVFCVLLPCAFGECAVFVIEDYVVVLCSCLVWCS